MKTLKWLYHKVMNFFFVYCPELYTRIAYFRLIRKRAKYNPPRTLPEKIQWLDTHIYLNNPEVMRRQDKYAVREVLKEAGCGNILNEMIAAWDDPEKIDWDALPDQFVIKFNCGCGHNIICPDKSKLDIHKSVNMMKEWMKVHPIRDQVEACGKGVKKMLSCEKYIGLPDGTTPIDYKIHFFNGKENAILVLWDRFTEIKAVFYDKDWNLLKDLHEVSDHYHPVDKYPEKPKGLDEMIRVGRILSKGFPFVRVDFYDLDGAVVFGELTFFPGDLLILNTEINGKNLGEDLDITEEFLKAK